MKKIILTAAAMMAFGATGAYANQCGLKESQLTAGWTCIEDTIQIGKRTWLSTERQGQSSNCAVYSADQTQTVYYSYNPQNNLAEDKTVLGGTQEGLPYRDGAARCAG